ncbi:MULTISPECIES: ABC transporter ATP-binding protein [unclassified Archaeoglobus]|uniref:ABC transporter ATP-binding protein n=1 Tax=unclassified Archaeoglobus TaxID=2643606 RepID=UPI0025BC288A|nr:MULTISPECIES: ABC transporter ATP-binding protein [unclassified Archaeoglobus]
MLKVKDVHKSFGELKVLEGVNLEVNKRERVGIIGPNGAGKTTLFNIISGFLRPDDGKVIFKNKNVVGLRPNQLAKMGLVRTFQIVKVFSNMTVEENILTISSDLDYLKDFGLWEKRREIAANLSYGELRKLSIALAIASNPKLLLLDEPFSGLSPKEARELADIIRDIHYNGQSIAIIEHRLSDLFDVAEKVLVLNSGKIIFEGQPDEVVREKSVIEAYLGKKYAKVFA